MAPDVPARAEDGGPGECPRRPDVPPQPEIGPHAGQPDREHRVEVERLPGLQPGIEQILERMQIARLALAEERQAAIEARAPAREPPGLQLLGEEGAIRIVDLGDVEVKEGPAQADGVPEEGGDRGGPDQKRDQVAPAPGRRSKSAAEPPVGSVSPLDTTCASLASGHGTTT